MDKFDQLSNNELRDQLKALGLGNFPVTDTTRNSLIKKLRNAVNGPAKSAKGRRETMNVVVKNSSAEESESDADAKKATKSKTANSRRATIAAGAAPLKPTSISNGAANEKVAPKPVPVRPKSPSRKSPSRIVPEPVSYFADASDDDLVAAAEEAEKKTARKSRSSRSPSLTKSSMVTTSYKHTIEPLIEHNDDVILLNDNSDAEFSAEMLEKVRKPSTPTTKITAPVENRRKTLQVGPSISTNYSSIKPTENPTSYEDSTSSSAYRRRYTTYASPAPSSKMQDDDDIFKKHDTPFLSDFTRRLAQLKAEQLPGTETTGYKTPRSTTTDYMKEYRSSVYATGGASDRYRPVTSLKSQQPESTWSKLEKTVRWPLLILFILFVVVFIYVFFFSNY